MKNCLFQLVFFGSLLAFSNGLNAQNGPKVYLESRKIDLDTLQTDTSYRILVALKNIGDLPIRTLYIKNSGGCLYAYIGDREPLFPEESRAIKINIDTKGRIGNQNKAFVIHSDDPEEPVIPVTCKFVIRARKQR